MGRWAMAGGVAWYLPLALMTFCLSPVAGVVCVLVLMQSVKADEHYPGRTAAIVSSGIGLGVSALFFVPWLANIAN